MKNNLTRNFAAFALAFIVLSLPFTAISQQPQPLGPYGFLVWPSVVPTATDTAAIKAQNMTSILVGTPTAAANYTTDTATNLCALFPAVANQNADSFSWDWYVKNTSGGANTITLVAGTGGTLVGTGTAAQNQIRHFKIVISGCSGTPAAKFYSLETAAF